MENVSNEQVFEVVSNDNAQFSLWDTNKEMPLGWYKVGVRGSKEVCLSHIKDVWKNILTISL